MSHSPIPWQIDFSTTQGPVAWKILDAQGKHIGYINCPVFDSTWERGSEANQAENVSAVITAGFLVRAVNYHDRLIEALEEFAGWPAERYTAVELARWMAASAKRARALLDEIKEEQSGPGN